MTKAIFFDYHGVLDKRTYQGMLRRLAELIYTQGDFESFLQAVYGKYALFTNLYASGDILPEHFWSKLSNDGLNSIQIQKLQDYILTVEINEQLLPVLEKLKENKFLLGVLSDSPSDKIAKIRHRWDLETYFDVVFFSTEQGVSKIEPNFYELMKCDKKFLASEVIYIEDNPKLVNMAKNGGFQAVVYNQDLDLLKYLNL
jgi:HAD superfamily hydrolase (TIGR01509 family)